MEEELPPGRNACGVAGCWETMVALRTRFCNIHRVQRQAKYQARPGVPPPAPELDPEPYEMKQEARRTSASLGAFVRWVEEHEGRTDTERQHKRHRYVVNASAAGKFRTVNSGGGTNSRGGRRAKAKAACTEEVRTCIICAGALGEDAGVCCEPQQHFCCFDCVAGIVVAWSGPYPLRIAHGLRCPEGGYGLGGCGGVYDRDRLRRGLPSTAAAMVTHAHVLNAQLPLKRAAHAAAVTSNLVMAKELWEGGVRDAAMARFQRHLQEELLVSRCPKCMLQYAGVKPGDCMAIECRLDGAAAGVKPCGVYICGWCDTLADTSGAMHRHVHDCPHKVGTTPYFSDQDQYQYSNYEESLRRRRAAKLRELELFVGGDAFEALRAAARPVLEMHRLCDEG